jgi:regulator of protease activity HflC (stomatin/prohibitin superfamily)
MNSTCSGVVLMIVGILTAVLFFVTGVGVVEIRANEVGVVYNALSGDLSDEPLGPGLHFIIPGVQDVTIYSTAQQEYTMAGQAGEGTPPDEEGVEALTKDGQQIRLDITIVYRIDPSRVNEVHIKWRNQYEQWLVRPVVRSIAREVVGEFDALEIYGEKRATIESEIEERVRRLLDRDGLQVDTVLIRNSVFSEEFLNWIEQQQ